MRSGVGFRGRAWACPACSRATGEGASAPTEFTELWERRWASKQEERECFEAGFQQPFGFRKVVPRQVYDEGLEEGGAAHCPYLWPWARALWISITSKRSRWEGTMARFSSTLEFQGLYTRQLGRGGGRDGRGRGFSSSQHGACLEVGVQWELWVGGFSLPPPTGRSAVSLQSLLSLLISSYSCVSILSSSLISHMCSFSLSCTRGDK